VWEDWLGCTVTVGIYVALGALCWWGAWVWESAFMFALGCVWWGMALFFALYFIRLFR